MSVRLCLCIILCVYLSDRVCVCVYNLKKNMQHTLMQIRGKKKEQTLINIIVQSVVKYTHTHDCIYPHIK